MRGKPSVLIVEDDPIVAMDLEEMAIRAGWSVVGPAYDLAEALEAAQNQQVDFALLDFHLGHGINWVPVAEALSARDVRYAFVTAANRVEVKSIKPDVPLAPKPISSFVLERLLATAVTGTLN